MSINKKEIDYGYTTQPGKNFCGNKSCKYSRGKVLGGTSVINGMHMTRGNRWDYDNWAKMGNPGWSWLDVLPYFKKSEDFRIPQVSSFLCITFEAFICINFFPNNNNNYNKYWN